MNARPFIIGTAPIIPSSVGAEHVDVSILDNK